jgi:hypothetical protein
MLKELSKMEHFEIQNNPEIICWSLRDERQVACKILTVYHATHAHLRFNGQPDIGKQASASRSTVRPSSHSAVTSTGTMKPFALLLHALSVNARGWAQYNVQPLMK